MADQVWGLMKVGESQIMNLLQTRRSLSGVWAVVSKILTWSYFMPTGSTLLASVECLSQVWRQLPFSKFTNLTDLQSPFKCLFLFKNHPFQSSVRSSQASLRAQVRILVKSKNNPEKFWIKSFLISVSIAHWAIQNSLNRKFYDKSNSTDGEL